MTAYATVSDVKARAGRLSPAWTPESVPGDGDIEALAEAESAELNASIVGLGLTVPAQGEPAFEGLRGWIADRVLVLMLDATWPGGEGEVANLRASALARILGYQTAWDSGALGALVVLVDASSSVGGASSLWTSEPGYEAVEDDAAISVELRPAAYRGMRF